MSSSNKLEKTIVFASLDAKKAREMELISVSAEKKRLADANNLNRLKNDSRYCKLSEEVLKLIVKHSSVLTLESLLQYKCVYTARNIAQCAEWMTLGKTVAMTHKIESLLSYLGKNQQIFVGDAIFRINNDPGRDSKIIKAMLFFNLIKIRGKTYLDTLRKTDMIELP